jgi:hypothetical protein
MSDINRIYELTKQLSSPESLKSDLKELTDIAVRYFSSKYLTPLNVAISSHREYCSSHPGKEVQLLKALKPFLNDSTAIDRLIDAVNTLSLFGIAAQADGIAAPALVAAASVEDSAVHPDGIYEVDEGCISTNSGIEPRDEACPLDDITDNKSIIIAALLFLFFANR